MSRRATRYLQFTGIDLVCGVDGRWSVLEINDHPIGLSVADDLAQHCTGAAFDGGGMDRLGRLLVSESQGRAVCLVLPDCFRIQGRHHAQAVVDPAPHQWPDSRIHGTLVEFRALADSVRRHGGRAVVADVEGVQQRNARVQLSTGEEVGALFRRCSRFPPKLPLTPCINDLRVRDLCGNKLKTVEVLRHSLDASEVPRTRPLDQLCPSADAMPEGFDGKLIVKPVRGSASHGIRRLEPGTIRSFRPPADSEGQMLVQEWIEPMVHSNPRGAYRFDFRIFLVGGEPVAGVARCAAAPARGVARGNPLGWLTTTGRVRALGLGPADDPDVVRLSETQWSHLKDLSQRCVLAVDRHAQRLDYEQALHDSPSFRELAGVRGRLDLIPLTPCGISKSTTRNFDEKSVVSHVPG